jgi:hypothetical protein
MPSSKQLIGRYAIVPVQLFRVQTGKKVVLRSYDAQLAKGATSFDLRVHPDGKVHAVDQASSVFTGPNGMSLRPAGPMLATILSKFKGRNIRVYGIPAGVKLPPQLTLLHEHTDHYSMQTTEPVKLEELEKRMTNFLNASPEVRCVSRDEAFAIWPDLVPHYYGISPEELR